MRAARVSVAVAPSPEPTELVDAETEPTTESQSAPVVEDSIETEAPQDEQRLRHQRQMRRGSERNRPENDGSSTDSEILLSPEKPTCGRVKNNLCDPSAKITTRFFDYSLKLL